MTGPQRMDRKFGKQLQRPKATSMLCNAGGPQRSCVHGPLVKVQKKSFYSTQKLKEFVSQVKNKKTVFFLQYGSSFILVHEMLGILSYVIVGGILYFHVVDLETVVAHFGSFGDALKANNLDIDNPAITFAVTALMVKVLDVFGLVYLRWALTFFLTPYVASLIGPQLDALVQKVWKRKKNNQPQNQQDQK
eukprot:TRINITY_DN1837_c0_g1_i1.p1 TRINITY_DN1837_c0_g1~~TRINITY_DN1837_c0_g1_i1.p1  ORF type:complete len:219 (-),score=51.04 TRINITY_DN1837_c0_g1_i1:57-629(-)